MEKQTSVIEMVLFKTKSNVSQREAEGALLSLNEILENFNGFMGRKLSISDDSEWLDIVYWTDLESAKKASDEIMKSPRALESLKIIDQSKMTFKHFTVLSDITTKELQ